MLGVALSGKWRRARQIPALGNKLKKLSTEQFSCLTIYEALRLLWFCARKLQKEAQPLDHIFFFNLVALQNCTDLQTEKKTTFPSPEHEAKIIWGSEQNLRVPLFEILVCRIVQHDLVGQQIPSVYVHYVAVKLKLWRL